MKISPRKRLARRIFKGFAILVTLGVLGVGVLLASLWLERRTAITLPTPTGPFAVGRAIYDWIDDAKLDTMAPVPGTKRELLVWIWYPSAIGQSVAMDEYVPGQMRAAAGPPGGLLGLLTRDLSKVYGHSLRNADVAPQQRSYPVVVMRAGASSEVANYSTLAEDLASHGYVVVGFDAPYRTFSVVFPDGRVIDPGAGKQPGTLCGPGVGACRHQAAGGVDRGHRVRARSDGAVERLGRIRQVHGPARSWRAWEYLATLLAARQPHNSALRIQGAKPVLMWTVPCTAASFRQASTSPSCSS